MHGIIGPPSSCRVLSGGERAAGPRIARRERPGPMATGARLTNSGFSMAKLVTAAP